MQQILAIHGGTTFAQYDDYIESLRSKKLYIDRMVFQPKWKERLQEDLGSEYQVLLPSMPNATNARYSEWKVWFDHLAEIIEDDCILIGHSLGGIFLAKYLSETTFPRRIKATLLVAAPYDDETGEDLTDFKISGLSEKLTAQAGKLIFFFGSDDPVVPLAEMEKFRHDAPQAEYHILSAPDHFVRASFPEIVERLKEIVRS